MYVKFIVSTVLIIILSTPASAKKLEQKYWSILDSYANSTKIGKAGGQIIFDTCGKLTLLTASYIEKAAFTAGFKQEEYDFRVNVCAKATINSVHPQPELSSKNKDITDQLCAKNKSFIYEICNRYLGY
jgi:hypothetical protein